MKLTQETEPPSCFQSPLFRIGQDSHGNWVAQDQTGNRGGLFVDRADALRYVRYESGNQPHAFVAVTGVLELDMALGRGASRRRLPVDTPPQRRAA